jgi:ligand-binding sensor domain-containing protein
MGSCRFAVLVFVACAVYPSSASSEAVPIWTVFNSETSDLLDRSVSALTIGPKGTVWVGGSNGGVSRLDGDGHWQAYSDASTQGGLPNASISALAIGANGELWIGTFAKGLTRLDKSGKWRTYTRTNTKGALADDYIRALVSDSAGVLWVGTYNKGLSRLDRDGLWSTYTEASTNGGLPSNIVDSLAISTDGSLWVGTIRGAARLDKHGHWKTYFQGNVTALAPSTTGDLWIGLVSGLTRIGRDGRAQDFTEISTNVGVVTPQVTAFVFDADGGLWIGTYESGLIQLDTDGHWRTYTRANTGGGLPSDIITSLAVDGEGAVWIGTPEGVARLAKRGPWETFVQGRDGDRNRARPMVTGSDGEIWLGSKNAGLSRLDRTGRIQRYTTANTNGGLLEDSIQALAIGADGELWVGLSSRGLARLDKSGHWQTYTRANTNRRLPGDSILALTIDPGGNLWISGSADPATGAHNSWGLTRRSKDGAWLTLEAKSSTGGLYYGAVEALTSTTDGDLWVVTAGGLSRWSKDGEWQRFRSANTGSAIDDGYAITTIASSSKGDLWAGSGAGVVRRHRDGHWESYTHINTGGGLPTDDISFLMSGSNDDLWVGTAGSGLARLGKEGHWEVYSSVNTEGGLPNDNVNSLAIDLAGGLWVSTTDGLSYFKRPLDPTHRITDVIGLSSLVSGGKQTISSVAFDSSFLTRPWMFHYVWRLADIGSSSNAVVPEITTKSPVYRATFDHDGRYRLQVIAVDRYGRWSEPQDTSFTVKLPQPEPFGELAPKLLSTLLSTGVLYFALIFLLIPLYPRFSWARTAVSSGIFTKFPLLHKTILNSRWARRYLFKRLAAKAATMDLPKPYIQQYVFSTADRNVAPLTVDGSRKSLMELFAKERRALLIARSGTGKSVFLRHLQRELAASFQRGQRVPAPVLIDLRTHVLSGRGLQDLICDALRGGGVELSDGDLGFLIRKGNFLILVDSLNELPDAADARFLHTYFNQDSGNLTLVTSQADLLRRQDTPLFSLVEVTPRQAASYLAEAVGYEVYAELPQEAQSLARNPQDLALLAEVITTLGTTRLPTHRAELYREILNQDGALRPWIESGSLFMEIIYRLAFRMVMERRVLQDDHLREWIAVDPAASGEAVAKIMQALRSSRLFRTELESNVLARNQPVTGFRHELIGKFLAARHVHRAIRQGQNSTDTDYIGLSGNELWLDTFYFVIDEIDSSVVLNRFLRDLLAVGGQPQMRICAYAIRTKGSEVASEVQSAYETAKLNEDLEGTPAAP